MSLLYISEYQTMAKIAGDPLTIAAPKEPANVDQTPIAIGASSVQSMPFLGNTHIIRVHTDVICSIAFGANPTATTSNKRLGAGATEYFGVTPGDMVAVIANT